MLFWRRKAITRLWRLVRFDSREKAGPPQAALSRTEAARRGYFSRLLLEAGDPLGGRSLAALCLLTAAAFAVAAQSLLPAVALPPIAAAGAALPIIWLNGRAGDRAARFAEEFPSILLATASSLKAGMTAYAALGRSVQLLPKDSLVRIEVEFLLAELARGVEKEHALCCFAAGIRQPELELFRRSYRLVLDHGGRFAPTLERLARVCRDRVILIKTARVSTATMRMTANVLLAVAPLVLLIIAARTPNFWTVLTTHPTANLLAATGTAIIAGSYWVLRRMSSFRP